MVWNFLWLDTELKTGSRLKKAVKVAVALALSVGFSGPMFRALSDYNDHRINAQWRICNVYGPTLDPRPALEWCQQEKKTRDFIAQETAKDRAKTPRPTLEEIFK